MTELVMLLVQTKTDVVNALKLKNFLSEKGIEVTGMVVKDKKSNGSIPLDFLEEMMQLRIVGVLV